MTNAIIPTSPHKNFEGVKKIDENGVEYWTARELLPLLGYANWQKAKDVIDRAIQACVKSGQDINNHFTQSVEMVEIGSNAVREIRDYNAGTFARGKTY